MNHTARAALLVFLSMLPTLVPAADTVPAPAWDTYADTWVATDALGRSLPGFAECGPPRPGKSVGIFYFLWLEGGQPVYDLSKVLAAPGEPKYGPRGAFHFWGRPLMGHYRVDDPFVLRKHAQMLADAGIDVACFDVTNGPTYDQRMTALGRVWGDVRALGNTTPGFAYLTNSGAPGVVKHLMRTVYEPKAFEPLWFSWKGRPLLMSDPAGLDEATRAFFTCRRSWAWTDPNGWFGDGRDRWPWLDHTPQKFGWHDSPDRPEQIAVAVAEHPTTNIGRSFHDGRQPPPDRLETGRGLHFAEQIDRALKVDPEFVFITGWNEWVAQRFIAEGPQMMAGRRVQPGDTIFIDQFSAEYSRDIEPMDGGHGDNYYYQLVAFVRRFKGVRPLPPVEPRPIVIDGTFDDWAGVAPEFRDTLGDPSQRDFDGWAGEPRFVDRSGRNDLAVAKVSADRKTIAFYVQTSDNLITSPDDGDDGLVLRIDADRDARTGPLGFDHRVIVGLARAERWDGSAWINAGAVAVRHVGRALELSIPREALTLPDGTGAILDFQWTDGIAADAPAGDFTLHGDAAPNDRFRYRAQIPAVR